jgi:Predicted dehydrogenases and related proteins
MIKVAVVGAGHWGPNLIRNFHNKETSVVVRVADNSQDRLQLVARRFPDVLVSREADQVFADASVEAVVIATPTSTHYALAKAALAAGKHVLVEKPITARACEGEELLALARKQGRVLMVGHVFVYNGAVRRVRRYVEEGQLGRVQYISMVRTNLGPIRMDVNAAWDLAAHDVSIANYWLGANAVSASALGGAWINDGVEDAVFATLRYPNQVLVNLHASWLNPRKARDVTVVGDQRMLTFDDMNLSEPIRIYDKHVSDERVRPAFVDTFASFRASVREGDITIPKVALGEPLKAECDHFLECIQNGQEPQSGGREGVAVVQVLEAISRSLHKAGREEEVR